MINLFLTVVSLFVISLVGMTLFRKVFLVVTVNGSSMVPALQHGDRLLVLRTWGRGRARQGQIVILKDPDLVMQASSSVQSLIVKRIVALEGETYTIPPGTGKLAKNEDAAEQASWAVPFKQIFVCGDNLAASRDSRTWGPLPLSAIQGIVLYKFKSNVSAARFNHDEPLAFLLQGQEAPDFRVTSTSGELFSLQRFRGQQLLLLFTRYHRLARSELPTLLSRATKLEREGIACVIVCGESLERARLMQEELRIPLPVLIAPPDQSCCYTDYQIKGTPCYYLINEQGKIADAGIPHRFSAYGREPML